MSGMGGGFVTSVQRKDESNKEYFMRRGKELEKIWKTPKSLRPPVTDSKWPKGSDFAPRWSPKQKAQQEGQMAMYDDAYL